MQVYTKEPQAIHSDTDSGNFSPEELKDFIAQALDSDKAENIVTISIGAQTGIADYMIVASGTSSRHVAAMAEKLKDRLNMRGLKGIRIEGLSQGDWVAVDAGDVIIHLFRPEVREFYNIEKMWNTYQPFHVVGDGNKNRNINA